MQKYFYEIMCVILYCSKIFKITNPNVFPSRSFSHTFSKAYTTGEKSTLEIYQRRIKENEISYDKYQENIALNLDKVSKEVCFFFLYIYIFFLKIIMFHYL